MMVRCFGRCFFWGLATSAFASATFGRVYYQYVFVLLDHSYTTRDFKRSRGLFEDGNPFCDNRAKVLREATAC